MRGTRYGDFSRFDDLRGYRGVLMQQGRVQLDADFNHEVSAGRRSLESGLADLLGAAWAPAGAAGFEVSPYVGAEPAGRVLLEPRELPDGLGGEYTLELRMRWGGGSGVVADWVARSETPSYWLRVDGHGRPALEIETAEGRHSATAEDPLPRTRTVHVAVVVGAWTVTLVADGRELLRVPARASESGPGTVQLGDPEDEGRGRAAALLLAARVRAGAASLAELAGGAPAEGALLASWPRQEGWPDWPDDRERARVLDLLIGAGRMYVHGVCCTLPETLRFSDQPGAWPLPSEGLHVVYVELWEETISGVQDPALLDPALGGLDTVVANRLEMAVRTAPVEDDGAEAGELLGAALEARREVTTGRLAAQHAGDPLPGNFLYRIEIQEGGHTGEEGRVTFKWSRRNGADLFAIAARDGAWVEQLPAPPGVLPLVPGDVVEPVRSRPTGGPPHALLRVVEAGAGPDALLRLSRDLPADAAFLRRWDQQPDQDEPPALAASPDWTPLEDGISVRFREGGYRAGDYWWLLARQDLGSIEWPQVEGHPAWLPPAGVERLRAPIALLDLRDGVDVIDLRRVGALPQPFPEPEPAPSLPEPSFPQLEPEPEWPPAAVSVTEEVDIHESARGLDIDVVERFEERVEEEPVDGGWRHRATVDLVGERLYGIARAGEAFVVATTEALFRVTLDGAVDRLAAIPESRRGFAFCLLHGFAYLLGGGPAGGRPDRRVLAFDLEAEIWTERARLPHHHHRAAVAAGEHHLHVAGGERTRGVGRRIHRHHHAYDVHGDRWQHQEHMRHPRAGAVAAIADGRLHVIGGTGHGRRRPLSREHEAHEGARGQWHREASLPAARPALAAAAHGHRLGVLVDGHDRRHPQSLLVYDAQAGQWEQAHHLPVRLGDPAMTGHDEGIVAVGALPGGGVGMLEKRLLGG